jgi:alpha-glucosidase
MLLGTRSTTLLYYGQEIGMVTTPPTRVEEVKDPIGITGWPKEKGRDGERTPMQWDATTNAGFTKGTPWLPVPPSAATVNVEAQRKDQESLLGWYKKIIAMRRNNPAVRDGVTTFLDRDSQHAVVWLRTVKSGASVVFAVNVKAEPVTLSVAADVGQSRVKGLKPLAVSHEALKSATPDAISLPPFGVYIGQIQR